MSWGFGVTDKVRFSTSTWTCGQAVYKRETLEGRLARKGIPKMVKTRRAKTRDRLGRDPIGTSKKRHSGHSGSLFPPGQSSLGTGRRPLGKADQGQLWPIPSLTTETANQYRHAALSPPPAGPAANQAPGRSGSGGPQFGPTEGRGPRVNGAAVPAARSPLSPPKNGRGVPA